MSVKMGCFHKRSDTKHFAKCGGMSYRYCLSYGYLCLDNDCFFEINKKRKKKLNNNMKKNKKETEALKDIIYKENENGNIVLLTIDGLRTAQLKEFVKQNVDGILYDLNRNEAVILSFIKDQKWVNDYATAQVIRELKYQLDKKTKQL